MTNNNFSRNTNTIQQSGGEAELLALRLAALGWKVFPCKPDKRPYTRNGFHDASSRLAEIGAWWQKWPGALVGIPCALNGFFAVDIDRKDGIDGARVWAEMVEAHGAGDVAAGPAQLTPSGGWHILFRLPADVKIPNTAGKLGPGLDLRSDGYICSGAGYSWLPDHGPETPLTDAPAWLLERIRQLTDKPAAQPVTPQSPIQGAGDYWLRYYLERAHVGARNDTGLALACQLRDSGLTASEAESVMLEYARSTPGDGYSEREALASLRSAYSKPQREPATLPGLRAAGAARTPADLQAAPGRNGHGPEVPENTTPAPGSGEDPGQEKKWAKSWEYINILRDAGYTFRLCELDDTLYVNQERMTDSLEAEIKSRLRDLGYHKVNVAADAYLAHARAMSFNPIRDYLNGLNWNGGDHILTLAGFLQDRYSLSEMILRKWMIGAVARVMTGGRQNRVMVLEGPQGLGKSYLARWLGSPLSEHFSEAMPNPDDKDTRLALTTTWIWEIKELGSVTRRADIDSLKAWLTLETIHERRSYGKYPIHKPAICSFIATVNDAGGFFNDPTGTRRYMTLALSRIDWGYAQVIDPNQLWAQAYELFKNGEDWNLSADDQLAVQVVNDEYEFAPPAYDWLEKYTQSASDVFTPTDELLGAMKADGLSGSDIHLSRQLAGWMKRAGYEGGRSYINVELQSKDGRRETVSRRVRGFFGVELRKKATQIWDSKDTWDR